jgi:hypothetical protein
LALAPLVSGDDLAALSIPDEHRGSLLKLASLSDAAVTELHSLLENATPTLRRWAFARTVGKKATTIAGDEAEGIVLALLEMSLVLETAEVSLDIFLPDVIAALLEGGPGLIGSEPEQQRMKERLSKLLVLPSVSLPAKGRALLIEHANYMCSARVFTDIRPVFGADVKQSPATAVIVHTLKLTYHQGEANTRNFFIMLDSHDLDEVSALIERARAKENSLKALLASTGLEPLE